MILTQTRFRIANENVGNRWLVPCLECAVLFVHGKNLNRHWSPLCSKRKWSWSKIYSPNSFINAHAYAEHLMNEIIDKTQKVTQIFYFVFESSCIVVPTNEEIPWNTLPSHGPFILQRLQDLYHYVQELNITLIAFFPIFVCLPYSFLPFFWCYRRFPPFSWNCTLRREFHLSMRPSHCLFLLSIESMFSNRHPFPSFVFINCSFAVVHCIIFSPISCGIDIESYATWFFNRLGII